MPGMYTNIAPRLALATAVAVVIAWVIQYKGFVQEALLTVPASLTVPAHPTNYLGRNGSVASAAVYDILIGTHIEC